MKIILSLVLLFLVSCAGSRAPLAPAPAKAGIPGAKIIRLHLPHQFVVLDFTARPMPRVGTKLPVYRGHERIGEVQLTEPVRGNLATADILSGDLRLGDEAR
ncbi:MAG: hypothetical protein PCFJNLEI_00842 [Verrucomicrobiae bacterium]|nr:hypothetical protein [Verrucomicrobiae bacterium]